MPGTHPAPIPWSPWKGGGFGGRQAGKRSPGDGGSGGQRGRGICLRLACITLRATRVPRVKGEPNIQGLEQLAREIHASRAFFCGGPMSTTLSSGSRGTNENNGPFQLSRYFRPPPNSFGQVVQPPPPPTGKVQLPKYMPRIPRHNVTVTPPMHAPVLQFARLTAFARTSITLCRSAPLLP